MTRVDIVVGSVVVKTEWNDSATARQLLAALPIRSSGSYWGKELYFDVPVEAELEEGAGDVVPAGAVAYWPPGPSLCLFWGPTPASRSGECRAASPVNVVGRVLNPEILPRLKAREVIVDLSR